jgi:hypothetical protein
MPGFNSVDSGYGSASFRPHLGASSPVSFPKLWGNTRLEDLHIPERMKYRYACLLARLIAESVAYYRPTHYVIDQICEALPDLLEQFALSIGGKNYSVMVVLLKYKM